MKPQEKRFLAVRLCQLLNRLGPSGRSSDSNWSPGNRAIREYLDRMSDMTFRNFHTLDLVARLLAELDSVKHMLDRPDHVEFVIFMLYASRRPHDPYSARTGCEYYSRFVDELLVERIDLLMAPFDGRLDSVGAEKDSCYLIDITLQPLASKPEQFDAYVRDISIEARKAGIDAKFRTELPGKLAEILEDARDGRLFVTHHFATQWSEPIIQNLERFLKQCTLDMAS